MARYFLLISFLISFVSSVSLAGVGETSADTLRRGIGARATAIGEAYSSLSDDIQSIHYNPGGMAHIPFSEVNATYLQSFIDDTQGSFSYGKPTLRGTWYLSGTYYDAGDIEINFLSGAADTRKAQQDLVGILGYSYGRNIPFSLGVNGKVFHSELAETASDTGYAVDSGFIWKTPLPGISFGGAAQNIGPDIKFGTQDESLPLTFRGGGSYLLEMGGVDNLFGYQPFRVLLSADAVSVKDEDVSAHAGVEIGKEFQMHRHSANATLRLGYISEPNTLTVGIGTRVSRMKLDYSMSIFDDIDETHRVTLSYVFIPTELINDSIESKHIKRKKRQRLKF